jgi:hypothetical protein
MMNQTTATVKKGAAVLVDNIPVTIIRITRQFIDVATEYDQTVYAYTSYSHGTFRKLWRDGRIVVTPTHQEGR